MLDQVLDAKQKSNSTSMSPSRIQQVIELEPPLPAVLSISAKLASTNMSTVRQVYP
jgi:hypothetical protein